MVKYISVFFSFFKENIKKRIIIVDKFIIIEHFLILLPKKYFQCYLFVNFL